MHGEPKFHPGGVRIVELPRLHLGCGTRHLPGYTNVDSREDVLPDLVCNVAELKDVPEGSIGLIYACHVLEHLNWSAALQRWNQLLVRGGVLRLSVPDWAELAKLYVNHGVLLERIHGLLYGRQDYPENVHYSGWDYERLANVLRLTGFCDVVYWNPYEVLPEDYHDYSYARITGSNGIPTPISLNVEAIKNP